MNKYIGTKLIEAEKATLAEAQALKTGAAIPLKKQEKDLEVQMMAIRDM